MHAHGGLTAAVLDEPWDQSAGAIKSLHDPGVQNKI